MKPYCKGPDKFCAPSPWDTRILHLGYWILKLGSHGLLHHIMHCSMLLKKRHTKIATVYVIHKEHFELPFSENAMLVIGPWCPGKLATLIRSFKSQIFIMESSVPVPKIRPSGWNWAQVRAVKQKRKFIILTWVFANNKATIMQYNCTLILFSSTKTSSVIAFIHIILLNNNCSFHLQVLHIICASYLDRKLAYKLQTYTHIITYIYIQKSTNLTNTCKQIFYQQIFLTFPFCIKIICSNLLCYQIDFFSSYLPFCDAWSDTLVRTRPVRISEKAQCWKYRKSTKSNENRYLL